MTIPDRPRAPSAMSQAPRRLRDAEQLADDMQLARAVACDGFNLLVRATTLKQSPLEGSSTLCRSCSAAASSAPSKRGNHPAGQSGRARAAHAFLAARSAADD